MQLEQSFELPFRREAAWAAFQDLPMLVSCLPGASLTSSPGATPLEFELAVKLGPIAANFSGQGNLNYESDYKGKLSGSGTDRGTGSRVKGSAAFELHEIEGGTRIRLLIDYALTGALAQFGRSGIIKELAAGITRQFAANLRSNLEARAGGPATGVATAEKTTGETAGQNARLESAAPARLDGAALLRNVLWIRIKRLLGMS